jgi:FkbM family methyltransferase
MDIKHYKVNTPKRPDIEDWRQAWHGYYRYKETEHEIEITKQERTQEVNCLLSIIDDISNRGERHINLIELGAGWGETCLALAGVIDFKLIEHNIKTYNYLAVEAEPYYAWLVKEHFRVNKLPINLLKAAISDKIGWCKFNLRTTLNNEFGQGITFGNFAGSKLKTLALAGYHLLNKKTIKVKTVTIDSIVKEHIDIIQCDVQGVEDKVIWGALSSIIKGNIDYWLIGTHSKQLNIKCEQLLRPWYECIVDILPSKEKQLGLCQDGLQLFRRREL